MPLTQHEENELRHIARSLWQDDAALARALSRRPPQADTTREWLVMLPVMGGLLLAAGGDHWHSGGCLVAGVLIASVLPLILSFLLLRR